MKWTKVATVESDSERGKTYDIKRHPTSGAFGCGCTAYRFSRGVKTCKHLQALGLARSVFPAARPVEHFNRPPETVERVQLAGETFTVRRAITFGPLSPAAVAGGAT